MRVDDIPESNRKPVEELKSLYALKSELHRSGDYLWTKWSFTPEDACRGEGLEKPLEIKYIRGLNPAGLCREDVIIEIIYVWSLS
jgi:hypothetical protein